MNKSSSLEHLTPTECNTALEAFVADEAKLLHLHMIARRRAGSDLEAEDLIQDAFTLVLNGTRAWPRGLDATRFLFKTIQSIANGERQKRKRRERDGKLTGDPPDEDVPCPAPTAAELLEMLQEDTALRDRALRHFEDDPSLQALAKGLLDGQEKTELLRLFDNDETRYQTARTRFRRKTQKLLSALPQTGGSHDQEQAREAYER